MHGKVVLRRRALEVRQGPERVGAERRRGGVEVPGKLSACSAASMLVVVGVCAMVVFEKLSWPGIGDSEKNCC